ncbi:MAG TPA: hypothetical protein VER33_13770, partial [Polyangiaceae bacterium]|nr:hypothetical protein [Polyangiaceae bacterium]
MLKLGMLCRVAFTMVLVGCGGATGVDGSDSGVGGSSSSQAGAGGLPPGNVGGSVGQPQPAVGGS